MVGDSQVACEVRGLRKSFSLKNETLNVLKGVDVVFKRGERIALLGASGSGKSTFLHILGTLDSPTAGEIFYFGEKAPFHDDRALSQFRNRYIGFVFQFHHLIPELNALENIMLPLQISGFTELQAKERAGFLLEKVGVEHRALHVPGELSGGEQQRVAVARAVALKPALVLADEPTGNLDVHNGRKILDLLLQLNEEENSTLVVATHNLEVSKALDRKLEMEDGVFREA